jgi:hypothetical protein
MYVFMNLIEYYNASRPSYCHTYFSKENQVLTYMHARIKFHAYSDIKVNTETVSRKERQRLSEIYA